MNKMIDSIQIGTDCHESITIEAERICPHCKYSFDGTFLYSGHIEENYKSRTAYVLHFCHSCERAFLTQYAGPKDDMTKLRTYPSALCETYLDPQISTISPKFIEIFHQAEQAESYGLMEICGLGYRRALEFLIKDYLIHYSADDNNKEKIKKSPLSQCIQSIPIENIKVTAQRSAWLGNDYAHYVSEHPNLDLDDLKKLVRATAYWVSMTLYTQNVTSEITSKPSSSQT